MSSDEDDYDAIREKNIAQRQAFMRDFFEDIKKDKEAINELEKQKKQVVNEDKKKVVRKRIKRDENYVQQRVPIVPREYNTRSRKRKIDDGIDVDVDENENNEPRRKSLKVMFSWSRPVQRDIDLMRFDSSNEEGSSWESEDEAYVRKKKVYKKKQITNRITRSVYDPDNIPSPDEVTEDMLENVADRATGKVYDIYNGTSCHQCRQKTRDTKTICRSGECIGVRGQFCGPCLRGRYGESALEALKDPYWACPPCRGICNCSICRTRNGKAPTGILVPHSKGEGYKSVKDYLDAYDNESD